MSGMRKRSRLSGAIIVTQRAKGRCFREFRGRAPMIETCLEAVKEATDLVATGKAHYFSDAVRTVSEGCAKRPMNDQIACVTGATEVLLVSKGVTASLDGRRKKRSLSGRVSLVSFLTEQGVDSKMFGDLSSEVSSYKGQSFKENAELAWAKRKDESCARLKRIPKSDSAAMTRDERKVCDAVEAWLARG